MERTYTYVAQVFDPANDRWMPAGAVTSSDQAQAVGKAVRLAVETVKLGRVTETLETSRTCLAGEYIVKVATDAGHTLELIATPVPHKEL